MSRTWLLTCFFVLWCVTADCRSVFYSAPQAHTLLRMKRANSMFEEIRPPSKERECVEEICDYEEAREIFQTPEATLEFWTVYKDGNQCNPNLCVNGTCVDKFQSFECSCNPGFEGKYCDQPSTASNCTVDNGDCDHECNLRSDGMVRTCSCLPGYSLHENSRTCSPLNENSCGRILLHKSVFNTGPIQGLMPWLIGGEVGRKGESPWQALLLNSEGVFHCGAVLIDKSWVLTAAHCLQNHRRFSVRLGDYERFRREGTEVTVAVADIISHPNYDSMTMDNDIGLLRLEAPVRYSTYILPACLPSRGLAEGVLHRNGTETIITGWGRFNESTRQFKSALNYIKIPLVDRELCQEMMMNDVSENVLCAGVLGETQDACEGDSGGPMMVEYRKTWFLIGLVSWGEGCGHKDKLGIYTKVSNYLEWIDKVRQQYEQA
ncbi:vitamin K-dependent protein C isoform X2 [Engraulis encrasicolus]|uniref:vitamin K-dependent protein C isoform X2 n=1 Tax=Engraulis encrasicolus TaxID=184585 RepID=UPI002FD79B6D